jgi:hypothetical protein
MMRLEDHVNFHGPDWTAIKLYLEQVKENKIGLLIQAKDHDTSNQIRGALSMIQQLLALESAAHPSR